MSAGTQRSVPNGERATTDRYLYGFVPAGTLRRMKADGVAGRAVQVVEGEGVSALVTDLPDEDLRVSRRRPDRPQQGGGGKTRGGGGLGQSAAGRQPIATSRRSSWAPLRICSRRVATSSCMRSGRSRAGFS